MPGGFKQLLSYFRINGQDMILGGMLESGRLLELPGGATVYFPNTTHAADPISGPVVVITTPKIKVRHPCPSTGLTVAFFDMRRGWHQVEDDELLPQFAGCIRSHTHTQRHTPDTRCNT